MKLKIEALLILFFFSSPGLIMISCKSIPPELIKKCEQVDPGRFNVIKAKTNEVFFSIKCNPITYFESDSIIIASCFYVDSENHDTIRIICQKTEGQPGGYMQIIKNIEFDLKDKKLFIPKDSLNYKPFKTIYADAVFLRI